MTDTRLLRTTLDTLDDFVESLRFGRQPGIGLSQRSDRQPRFVIDEGRATAEWELDIDFGGAVERVGLLVVCEVDDDRLSDARLYVALPRSEKEHHS